MDWQATEVSEETSAADVPTHLKKNTLLGLFVKEVCILVKLQYVWVRQNVKRSCKKLFY